MRNIILFLFLLPLMAYGQTYKYIGVEDGLSNRRIYNIQKDRQGYICGFSLAKVWTDIMVMI